MATPIFSPDGLFEAPSLMRILRIDAHFRYAMLMAKAHGVRPDSRLDFRMEDFAANCVLRGEGTYVQSDGRRHPLMPGTLFQRLPGRSHSTILDPESDYAELFLVLDRRTARDLLALGLLADAEVLPIGSLTRVVNAFISLRRDLGRPESDLPTRAALLRITQFLGDLYESARHAETGDEWSRITRQACILLERDLDRRMDVGDVAQALGVAYPTFRRRFREAVGVSPGAYRVRCRLEQARALLLDHAVQEVAARLGYSDPFTFSAQFKAYFGLSPRRFQEQHRGGRETA